MIRMFNMKPTKKHVPRGVNTPIIFAIFRQHIQIAKVQCKKNTTVSWSLEIWC